MTPTSIDDEKQACISGGVNPQADIASGRITEVRSRSMSCNCMTRTSQQECRSILEFTKVAWRKLKKQVLWNALVATARKRGTLEQINSGDRREIFDFIIVCHEISAA